MLKKEYIYTSTEARISWKFSDFLSCSHSQVLDDYRLGAFFLVQVEASTFFRRLKIDKSQDRRLVTFLAFTITLKKKTVFLWITIIIYFSNFVHIFQKSSLREFALTDCERGNRYVWENRLFNDYVHWILMQILDENSIIIHIKFIS